MSFMHGKQGRIDWEAYGPTGAINEHNIDYAVAWSGNFTCDTADSTAMATSPGFKSRVIGYKDWNASVTTLFDEDDVTSVGMDIPIIAAAADGDYMAIGQDVNVDSVPSNLELWFLNDGASNYIGIYGPAICKSVKVTTDKNDLVKITYEFQGTGPAIETAILV